MRKHNFLLLTCLLGFAAGQALGLVGPEIKNGKTASQLVSLAIEGADAELIIKKPDFAGSAGKGLAEGTTGQTRHDAAPGDRKLMGGTQHMTASQLVADTEALDAGPEVEIHAHAAKADDAQAGDEGTPGGRKLMGYNKKHYHKKWYDLSPRSKFAKAAALYGLQVINHDDSLRYDLFGYYDYIERALIKYARYYYKSQYYYVELKVVVYIGHYSYELQLLVKWAKDYYEPESLVSVKYDHHTYSGPWEL